MILPHTIHDDASSERVLGTREPFGERGTTACSVRRAGRRKNVQRLFIEHRKQSGFDRLLRLLWNEQRRRRRADVGDNQSVWQRRWFEFVELRQLLQQANVFLLVVGVGD